MAEAMLGPYVAPALLVLVANDHVLKQRWPGLVTGKLSDVVGLVVFPVLLVALLEAARLLIGVRPIAATRRELVVAALLTAGGFTAVKLSGSIASAYSQALGCLQWPVRAALALLRGGAIPSPSPVLVRADPWDLVALPAIALAIWAAHRSAFRDGALVADVQPSGAACRRTAAFRRS
jgi:hypothetical protein